MLGIEAAESGIPSSDALARCQVLLFSVVREVVFSMPIFISFFMVVWFVGNITNVLAFGQSQCASSQWNCGSRYSMAGVFVIVSCLLEVLENSTQENSSSL